MNKLLTIASLFLLLGASSAQGQKAPDVDFADFLYQRGEYYRAITEYYRLLHASSDSMQQTVLIGNIGRCYYDGGDYTGFLRFHRQNSPMLRANPSAQSGMFLLLGKSYYQLGQYGDAADMLECSGVRAGDPVYPELSVLLGISRARTGDWSAAQSAWRNLAADTSWSGISEYLLRNLEPLAALPQRSAFLAGTLSAVLPGSGYLYAGRPGTAIASLLINGLLVWAVADAVRHDQYGIAAAAGFLGAGWYVGNIIGSAAAAREYSEQRRHAELDLVLKRGALDEYVRQR